MDKHFESSLGLIATEFMFAVDHETHQCDAPTFHRMRSPFYEGEKWAVRRGRVCLTTEGDWEYEPMPSSRDDEFYKRCRFDSLEHAVMTAKDNLRKRQGRHE